MKKAQAMADVSLHLGHQDICLPHAFLHRLSSLGPVCMFFPTSTYVISLNLLKKLFPTTCQICMKPVRISKMTWEDRHTCTEGQTSGAWWNPPPAVQHLHCCEPEELQRTSTVPGALGWDPKERSRVLAVPVPWSLSQPQPSTPEQLCPPEAVTPSSSVGATIPCKQRPTSRCSNGLKARHGALLYGQR